jgi:hypothetical protein
MRHAVLGLAVGISVGLFTTPVFADDAPPMRCSAKPSAVPQVRAEGITELVGDIVLTCNGGTPIPAGQLVPQVNVVVNLSTPFTSSRLENGGSEALLLIDEPAKPGSDVPTPNPCLTRV